MSMNFSRIEQCLVSDIEQNGPLPIARFMEIVLGHPEYGYYMRQDPFGVDGDFTTAPEISQMFGEMIGLWLADIWMQFGQPEEFILLECGPGRGTMMADILRVTRNIRGFHDALDVHLLETSPVLRSKQEAALKDCRVSWHESLESVSGGVPVFIIANEFFDALPVRQFQFDGQKWQERKIEFRDGFQWLLEDIDFDPADAMNLPIPTSNEVLEISGERDGFANEMARIIKRDKGAALIIDYGYLKPGYGDTLQALYKHKHVETLSHIGEADLTAHVNFARLNDIFDRQGLDIMGMNTQGGFLKNLGIQVHASKLLQKAGEQQGEDIQNALHRLTHSDEMGTLFKVTGVSYGAKINPAGF